MEMFAPRHTQSCRPTYDDSTFDNRMTFTFDLLTSGSKHAGRLPCMHVYTKFGVDSSSRFPIERGHTYASATAGMGNETEQ